MALLTLLTDFGLEDGTVGVMHGRVHALAPDVAIVDLSHAVPPQDVRAGAYLLERWAVDFEPPVVHVAVVDPGVGTTRRALAAQDERGAWYVGPDNGLLGVVAESCRRCLELDPARVAPGRTPSATFHGRDLFAPAGALLARGEDPSSLGADAAPPRRLPPSRGRDEDGLWADVVWSDHFGNALTELPAAWLEGLRSEDADLVIECGDLVLRGLHRTYGEVEPGAALAYVGSGGTLELAVREGDLRAAHGIVPGTRVRVWSEKRS